MSPTTARIGLCLLGVCVLWACGDPPPEPVTTADTRTPPERPLPPVHAPHLYFRDITAWAGIDFPGNATATGATFVDLDGDGDDDLLLPGPEGTHVMHNRGDGSFETVQTIPDDPPMVYTYALDFSGDGVDDVLLVDELGAQTWESVGGRLEPRPDLLFVEDLVLQPAVATLGDFSGRGHHDLFLGRSLIKTDGHVEPDPTGGPGDEIPAPDAFFRLDGGAYREITADVGLTEVVNTLSAMSTDLDGDGRLDLIVGTQHDVPDRYYLMGADGRFVEASEDLGLFDPAEPGLGSTSAMGFDGADVDGDGDMDLYLTDDNPTYGDRLYLQDAPGHYRYATLEAGLHDTQVGVGWGVGLHDFDHNGTIDLFVANGRRFLPEGVGSPHQENFFYAGAGDGRFVRVQAPDGSGLEAVEQSFGAVFSDIDNDGDLDVLVQNVGAPPTLLRNELGVAGRWLQIRLRHPTLSPVVGARIALTAGTRRLVRWVHGTPSFGGSSTHRVHFGLGDAAAAEDVEVRWPDGTVQTVGTLSAGQVHEVVAP